ncbi:MAG: hypothetical protein ABIQ40_20500 [Bacteroidia bacterium]
MQFARDKGAAENYLISLKFDRLYIFRPGYIYPVTPRKEPNFSHKLMRALYKPVLKWLYPNIGISSEELAKVMVNAGINGADKIIFENKALRAAITL